MSPRELLAAYLLDVVLGDPSRFPHPVRGMGWLVQRGETIARSLGRGARREWVMGALITAVTLSASCALAYVLLRGSQMIGAEPWVAALLAWTTLATRSLDDEVRRVLELCEAGKLEQARASLAHLVGRDTDALDESEMARALVETVAESTSDGVVAPLFFLAVGGPVAAIGYKAVNTLDSMIGHPEPPYRHLGRVAARLDDVCNFFPARLTALGILLAAVAVRADARRAWRVWRCDGSKHPSPNAGQPEAAMAGALGVRLGGVNHYDGTPQKRPFLGKRLPPPGLDHVRKSLRILWIVSASGVLAALVFSSWKYGVQG